MGNDSAYVERQRLGPYSGKNKFIIKKSAAGDLYFYRHVILLVKKFLTVLTISEASLARNIESLWFTFLLQKISFDQFVC